MRRWRRIASAMRAMPSTRRQRLLLTLGIVEAVAAGRGTRRWVTRRGCRSVAVYRFHSGEGGHRCRGRVRRTPVIEHARGLWRVGKRGRQRRPGKKGTGGRWVRVVVLCRSAVQGSSRGGTDAPCRR